MADIVGTLCRGDGGEGRPYRRPQAGHRARGDGPPARFQFCKDLFDGIAVWAVGGQVEQMRTSRLDRVAHPSHFMARQIVHDDIVARVEGGGEDLFARGHDARAIDRAVEDGGGGELVCPQGGNDRGCLPVAVGDFRHEAGPTSTPAIPARPLRLESGLVQEDEPLPVPVPGLRPPVPPSRYAVRPGLCGGVQDFFLLSDRDGARPARPWGD